MEEDLPARPVVSRSPVRTVRLLNLQGVLDRPVECESTLERDFVYRAALCPSVASVRHQPFRLALRSSRSYVPDFLVRHKSGQGTVVEVKPDFKHDENTTLFDEAADQLNSRGLRFAVAGESAIRKRDAHLRAALVLRYRKARVRPAQAAAVLELLTGHLLELPIAHVAARCDLAMTDVLCLIALRVLVTTASVRIDSQGPVSLPSRYEESNEIRVEDWLDVANWRESSRGCSSPWG